ncbi:MAG: acyltransferase family protein [Myxococcaceae bacterium]
MNSRNPGLDAARAWAVVAMVTGHSFDALLDVAQRSAPWYTTYTLFRGMTAPLFLFVSGCAVAKAVMDRQRTGFDVLRRYVPRALGLIALGAALRWPSWDVQGLFQGSPELLKHFLGVDALACIGISLILTSVVFAGFRGLWIRLAALSVLVLVAVAWSAPARAAGLGQPWQALFVDGPESPFPLLPWTGFFVSGALLGVLISHTTVSLRAGFAVLGVGVLMGGVTLFHGLSELPKEHPVLFLLRLAFALVTVGAALLLPRALASRVAPLGRMSLGIYVFHVPVLYGWGTHVGLGARIGSILEVGQVLCVSVLLLITGTLGVLFTRWVKASRGRRRSDVLSPIAIRAAVD